MTQNSENEKSLRETFDSAAELYHRIRPNYPEQLFDELVQATHLASDARLLEIGPGTGQATSSLARRGYTITAIELGDTMAKVARRELDQYKNVQVMTGSFEETESPAKSFDLIYAASAFHWIQADVKFTKPHALLKSGGHLAVIHTTHIVDEESEPFFYATQPIHEKYRAYRPKSPSDPKTPIVWLEDIEAEEFDEHFFNTVFYKVFPVKITYTAKEYADLLNTFSHNRAMPDAQKENFLRDMENLIEKEYGGSVVKPYAISLTVGQKID
jgi:ubiquinone/menaquinone biosynthesis C-methylase UbiE